MTDYVRVREGGWEYTIPKSRVADGVEVLDKDPLGTNGKPAPPKPVTKLGTAAPGSKQARKKTSGARASGGDAGQSSASSEQEN